MWLNINYQQLPLLGGVVPGRSPAQTGIGTTEAALTGGSLIKMPQTTQGTAATRYSIN